MHFFWNADRIKPPQRSRKPLRRSISVSFYRITFLSTNISSSSLQLPTSSSGIAGPCWYLFQNSTIWNPRFAIMHNGIGFRSKSQKSTRYVKKNAFCTVDKQTTTRIISIAVSLYTRWRIPAPALANSCTGVDEFLHRRWRIPAPALARYVSQVYVDTSEHHHPR